MFASWMKLRSTVEQTTANVKQASGLASGIQQKHTQESYEKAQSGDPEAIYDLGERFYDGRGLPRDYHQAAEWFAKAAEVGHIKAQTNLGLMYIAGRGVPKDRSRAINYLKRSAQAGDTIAQDTLRKIAGK